MPEGDRPPLTLVSNWIAGGSFSVEPAQARIAPGQKLALTLTYHATKDEREDGINENFKGVNPFPVDVIVDKDGTIVYIAREYDPDAMDDILTRLLAE